MAKAIKATAQGPDNAGAIAPRRLRAIDIVWRLVHNVIDESFPADMRAPRSEQHTNRFDAIFAQKVTIDIFGLWQSSTVSR